MSTRSTGSIIISARKPFRDRKSTRLNSSHVAISYAVFCLEKKIVPPDLCVLCLLTCFFREQAAESTRGPHRTVGASSVAFSVFISFRTGFFFFNDTATTEIYTLSLHDALPISMHFGRLCGSGMPSLSAVPSPNKAELG